MPDNSRAISFYFFDLDDNTSFLETPIFVRNTKPAELKEVSTHEFATIRTVRLRQACTSLLEARGIVGRL